MMKQTHSGEQASGPKRTQYGTFSSWLDSVGVFIFVLFFGTGSTVATNFIIWSYNTELDACFFWGVNQQQQQHDHIGWCIIVAIGMP